MQVGKSLITTHVLPRFFFALLISFIGTGLGGFFIPPGIAMAIGFIPLIVLIALLLKSIFGSGKKRRKGLSAYGMVLPMWLVYLFTLLMGISIYPVIDYYVDSMGAMMVIVAFGITSALFGGLFLYTYFTKKDFTFLGGILFFSLLALILVSIVGMFIGSDLFYLVLAWVGVVIFSGYILYDVSRMKKDTFTEKDVPAAVFDLYLNFINLFLDILRILNAFKK
ncbi:MULTISPECIES: Bax inhibitor-1/YccA family protein [Gottfriedia]|uniref:Uncharacterized protein n=1 Tax=Gottfriedia solisilvae TaxID=1516104 RepID=A0A8J3AJI5_9BACI|nr:Bax inhibitor-1/YccA family protein [Gottfriedia solisilvae]GGI13980.1 hypothetical protein GCM10007380_20650 [Gottfriedia solisilvae]